MIFSTDLLDGAVSVAELDIADRRDSLFPNELNSISRAVPRRVMEFSTGRMCARQALAHFGYGSISLPSGPDRVPLWPEGLVGSITHTRHHCAAAVARTEDGIRSIGIDLEPATPLPLEIWNDVLSSKERSWLDKQPSGERSVLARAVFSAKEACFKMQFLLTHQMMEFNDLDVTIAAQRRSFSAQFTREVGGFDCGELLEGRLALNEHHCATTMVLR